MINKKLRIAIYFIILLIFLCVIFGFTNNCYAQEDQNYKVTFKEMTPWTLIIPQPVFNSIIELNGEPIKLLESKITTNPEIYIKMQSYDENRTLQWTGEITKPLKVRNGYIYTHIVLTNIKLNPEYRPYDNYDINYYFRFKTEPYGPTPTPTATPVITESPTPTITPTATPTIEPTATPTATPVITPTVTPVLTEVTTETPTPINVISSSVLPQAGENDNYFKIIFSLFIIFIGFIIYLLAKYIDI